jgi:hypothetical protein
MPSPIERIAALEAENEDLRARLRITTEDVSESDLDALVRENERLRANLTAENEDAFLQRLAERRDELAERARTLRSELFACEREKRKAEQPLPSPPPPEEESHTRSGPGGLYAVVGMLSGFVGFAFGVFLRGKGHAR